MKVSYSEEERYPDHRVSRLTMSEEDEVWEPIEVEEEVFARWQQVAAEYDKMQDEISDLIKAKGEQERQRYLLENMYVVHLGTKTEEDKDGSPD